MSWILALLALAGVAAAAEVSPLVEPGNAAAWDRARDAARLAREYERNELSTATTPDGPVVDWAFRLKQDHFADIFLRRRIDTPFERIRLRVRNLGEKLTLAAKLGEDSGSEWTVDAVPVPPGGEWQTIEFARKAWHVASWSKDANGRLDFPVRYLALIAFGVDPGHDYHLQFGDVSVVRPAGIPAGVTAKLPARVNTGQPVEASVTVTPSAALPADGYSGEDTALELWLGKDCLVSQPLIWSTPPSAWAVGQPVTGRTTFSFSRWAPGGQGEWRLRLSGVRLRQGERDLPDGRLQPVALESRQPAPLDARVKPYHGAPTLFLNDRPVPGMAYAAYGPSPEVFRQFGPAGVRLFEIMGTPTSHGYGLSVDTWVAPGEFDYHQLDERIRMVLDACPDGYVLPRVYVSAPPWWLEQHPEAVVLYDPGDGKPVPFIQNGRKVPSWSSPAWRQATEDALRRLVAHVESQPYADRLIGYHIASGTTEEWMMWGANDDAWTDYSPDNTAAFRAWLRARYRDDAGLRAAWGRPEVTLATATVPSRKERATSPGVLRNPTTDTPSIDYYRYIADMTADTIDRLCGAVKRATGGKRLAGVFYGYLLQLFGQRQQNAAHLGFDRVVRSPNVDFLCSPTSYAFRPLGSGTSHFMAPLGSVLAHGKLWFDENDIRTSLSPGRLGEWGRPADVAGDMLQQDRELANVLVNGTAQWWFDVGSNRYDDPKLMTHLAHLTEVAKTTLECDRSPVDQVALVVDGRGLADLRVGDPLMGPLMLAEVPALARIGAPVGHYELGDVDRLARAKMVVFAGLYEPTAAQRAAIDKLKGDGRVLVFTHAPAPYRDGKWAPEQMAAVSGLTLKLEDRELAPQVKLGTEPLVAGVGEAYGFDRPTRPTVVGADPAATVLGTLPDGSPGLLLRKYPTWTAVWSAAPALPTALLVRLAELAGVHRYVATPDVIWASRDLLALSVQAAGPRTVRLPGPSRVTDLYAGREVCAKADTFDVNVAENGTVLWQVEPVK